MRTILDKALSRILDMKDASGQANHKLAGTLMFVNGELKTINTFDIYENVVYAYRQGDTDLKAYVIKTLEVFMPETGLYHLDDGNLLFIRKSASHQYSRSYNGLLYCLRIVYSGKSEPCSIPMLYKLVNYQHRNIAVNRDGYIFYWDECIGYVKDENTVVCTKDLYKQELKDWSRDA